MLEIWKPVEGFDHYEISNLGVRQVNQMIKIEFKEAQSVWQHGLNSECLFCYAMAITECEILTQVKLLHFSKEQGDSCFVFTDNIKSISKTFPGAI